MQTSLLYCMIVGVLASLWTPGEVRRDPRNWESTLGTITAGPAIRRLQDSDFLMWHVFYMEKQSCRKGWMRFPWNTKYLQNLALDIQAVEYVMMIENCRKLWLVDNESRRECALTHVGKGNCSSKLQTEEKWLVFKAQNFPKSEEVNALVFEFGSAYWFLTSARGANILKIRKTPRSQALSLKGRRKGEEEQKKVRIFTDRHTVRVHVIRKIYSLRSSFLI